MNPASNRQWLLQSRPSGRTVAGHLVQGSTVRPQAGEGDIVVRVRLLCLDPTIRNFMDADPGYGLPIALGGVVRGMVIGEVIETRSERFAEGAMVWGFGSWSDFVAGPAAQFHPVPTRFGHALPAYAHALGTIGLTAHYGLFDIAALRAGEHVLVSGAAGAVGSLVGQFARLGGAASVVGIAGGADKCARAVRDYGYDLCLDYKQPDTLAAGLAAAFPRGIDVVFENVGGHLLDLALQNLNRHARIALCGMIARYGAPTQSPAPDQLWNLVTRSARIEGFLVSNILPDAARTTAKLEQIDAWIKAGKLRYDIDLRHGFASVPAAFDCLFSGAHHGRLVVQLEP